ncbi:MAG: class I SAM-dependent methyltransferase [Cyclobacteriaceae bacterium]
MQTERVEFCPVCKGTSFEHVIDCEDYTYSRQHFSIQQCLSCQLLLTNPRPDQNSIGDFYRSEEYISHSGKTNSIFDWIYLRARNFTLGWKHDIITSRKTKGTILDYGCGTGEFINYMADKSWGTSAVEPSDEARAKVKSQNKNISVHEKLEELTETKFDVITLWHVLEHVPNPNTLIAQLKEKLNEGGLIFVAVPNHESYDAKYYQAHWAAYDVPRHFWHFAKANIEKLFDNNKLELKKVLPMKLDAYYVSLLSEKYKNNSKHNLATPIKALLTGWKSNTKARKTMNYSSLIYIAGNA